MSTAATTWVWKHSQAQDTDRLVLLAIADAADAEGDNAWPSLATIADYVRKSERTVRRSLRSLTELGELEVEIRAGGKREVARNDLRPNLYRLPLVAQNDRTHVTPRSDDGSSNDRTQLRPVTHDPSLENDRTSETERPDTPGVKTTGHCCPINKTSNTLLERGEVGEDPVDNLAEVARIRESAFQSQAVAR